jgi:uncharacterized membrane protein YhaH (DUF805 family)
LQKIRQQLTLISTKNKKIMVQPTPTLDIVQAVQQAISHITDMNGRARRSEFWWTMLAAFLVNLVFYFIPVVGPFLMLAVGVALVPLQIRRLHDTGKGATLVYVYFGIYALLMLIMFIGATKNSWDAAVFFYNMATIIGLLSIVLFVMAIVLIVFWCQDSQPFPNQYGISPKYPNGTLNNGGGYQQPMYGPQQPQQPYGPQQTQYGPQQPQQPY